MQRAEYIQSHFLGLLLLVGTHTRHVWLGWKTLQQLSSAVGHYDELMESQHGLCSPCYASNSFNRPHTAVFSSSISNQGLLQIWMEHSNLSITRQGGLKTPTETKYFFDFFLCVCENTFLCIYVKPKGMAQFDTFHSFVENSVF